jgi:translocation and assembly module TamB
MSPARAAWTLLLVLLLCALALAGAGAWVLYSSSGLQWLAARGVGYAGERLEIRDVSGTLAGGARAGAIEFASDDVSVRVQQARFTLSPWSLLVLSPRVNDLGAARVEVRTQPGDDARSPLPDSIALPIDVSIRNARIGTFLFDDSVRTVELSNVHLEYAGGRRRHEVKALDFAVLGHAIALRGTIGAHKPFALKAHIAAVRPAAPAASMTASVSGDLSALRIEAHAAAAAARANAVATIRPADAQPIEALDANVRDLDPHALDARLPHAAIRAEIALARSQDGLQGRVAVHNALPGPVDRQRIPLASLEAEGLARLPAATVALSRLRADLGAAGNVSGTGNIEGEDVTLNLAIGRLDLRGLYSTLVQTHLTGATMLRHGPSGQSVAAELTQADIRLALAADRNGDDIAIKRLDAQARGGSVEGTAHINLAGRKPFGAQVRLSRFDPSAWGDFPQAAINASMRADGVADEPAARIEFAIGESRLLGAPLAGEGVVEGSRVRLAHADVTLALDANRLTAKGAFGGEGDSLALELDASRLGVVDERIRGRVRAAAVVSGSFQVPRIRFDASATDLGAAGYGSVRSVHIKGRTSLEPDTAIEVQAALAGVTTPQMALQSASVRIDGRRSQHEASVQALGAPVDLRLRLRGALSQQNVWSGTVLELVNRGEIPVELAQPVTLELAPGRAQVQPFELRAVGGRLVVDALDYGEERLHTAGRFESLPVVRLVELFSRQAPVKGSLRLSGRWDVATRPQLQGSLSIARESGDLLLGAGEPLDLGLRSLSASAEIDAARIAFQAEAELALARAAASGRIDAVPGGEAIPYTAQSPLEFSAQIDVERLAPIADFIATAMILRGEAHARLQGRGTLGEPEITGQIRAANLGITMPADGVILTEGSLAAEITPQQVRIESFSIRGGEGLLTAQGTLARTGFDRASLDWRAERFTALARPDRKLVVSGAGNAALENKRLSMTGEVRVVEGEFALGDSALPTLSSDVVIAGRERRTGEGQARTFQNLALDLGVDLGNRVHVSGQGLSVWLSGQLRVTTNQRGELQASGTVRTRDGTFEAYGQRLVVDRGSIFFNGPLDNPGLDIVAMRKRQAVEAGVALTGTLKTPLVRVISDPPLPEGEALSWLVLGRSPNEAGTGELSALPLASNLLLGKAANPLRDALKLDELGLRGGAAGEQLLTLGKRLTDRLYLVFEQGFGVAATLVRLEYNLTRRVVLRLQAGESSGGGIFYRRRWD